MPTRAATATLQPLAVAVAALRRSGRITAALQAAQAAQAQMSQHLSAAQHYFTVQAAVAAQQQVQAAQQATQRAETAARRLAQVLAQRQLTTGAVVVAAQSQLQAQAQTA